MMAHGAMDLLCISIRDKFGVEFHNEPLLTESPEDAQKLGERV
ncbi:hypothetical protein [Methanoculleus sp. UBA303]|jgi:hypothetical protein|nr:hypothetical protein [Methanoculleus sp. UBA303]